MLLLYAAVSVTFSCCPSFSLIVTYLIGTFAVNCVPIVQTSIARILLNVVVGILFNKIVYRMPLTESFIS